MDVLRGCCTLTLQKGALTSPCFSTVEALPSLTATKTSLQPLSQVPSQSCLPSRSLCGLFSFKHVLLPKPSHAGDCPSRLQKKEGYFVEHFCMFSHKLLCYAMVKVLRNKSVLSTGLNRSVYICHNTDFTAIRFNDFVSIQNCFKISI